MVSLRMKYMGSKRWMLENGLSDALDIRIKHHDRFVDLFCGSCSVSWFVSQRYDIPVLANDLQEFCRILAECVICRTTGLGNDWIDSWLETGTTAAQCDPLFQTASILQNEKSQSIRKHAETARKICKRASGPITSAYGGYYFSPLQTIYFDHLRKLLPRQRFQRTVALGALIHAASVCAASPGHTAQPFAPTETAEPYLRQSWARDVLQQVKRHATLLGGYAARRRGLASKGDANEVASKLKHGDLVFVDPPYSSVQYSRFYHVLETVAYGKEVTVSGTGRYPPLNLRPRSSYSTPTESTTAICDLLATIRSCRSTVLITFPAGSASNGLSGEQIVDIAKQWFKVDYTCVNGRFSTLGGNTKNRSARKHSKELLMSLTPN